MRGWDILKNTLIPSHHWPEVLCRNRMRDTLSSTPPTGTWAYGNHSRRGTTFRRLTTEHHILQKRRKALKTFNRRGV